MTKQVDANHANSATRWRVQYWIRRVLVSWKRALRGGTKLGLFWDRVWDRVWAWAGPCLQWTGTEKVVRVLRRMEKLEENGQKKDG